LEIALVKWGKNFRLAVPLRANQTLWICGCHKRLLHG